MNRNSYQKMESKVENHLKTPKQEGATSDGNIQIVGHFKGFNFYSFRSNCPHQKLVPHVDLIN